MATGSPLGGIGADVVGQYAMPTVLGFRRRHAPAVRAHIAAHGGHALLIEATTRRQVDELLARLGRSASGAADG
ncbi:hypothetical protein ACQEVZ_07675 [Dactylosporangium sp. CA-152071]|uniref:hypothetical protein n=1 Tax=Dactylosporangium sp. CA-152071 TaxID=3239933 RepID=UPI003D8FECC5